MAPTLEQISELQAIGQNGLAYANNAFDKERYQRLIELAAEMAATTSDLGLEAARFTFADEAGYATPKLDSRALILDTDQVLLVRERSDNLWTLPGGWVDINESPSEAVVREVREETGYVAEARRLLALWDKQKHDHPPQWPHTYKLFFLCEVVGGAPEENIEIAEIRYFPLDQLPELSTNRITERQIARLVSLAAAVGDTAFD